MTLELRQLGDPVLKSRTSPVESFDEPLTELAGDMLAAMREHEGVGLAANQVGRTRRLLVAALEDEEHSEEYVIVNPRIENTSENTEIDTEGCLSIPEVQVEVERPAYVTISGQDLSGEPLTVEAEGLLARILQHEVDHLDGLTILDRTDRASRKAAMRQMRERMMTRK